MGKQYCISELMNGYEDSEFLIEGQRGADAEAVLKGVMEKVKPEKRLRFGLKVLAAAAVAVAVSVTAAVTAVASHTVREYTLADGGTLTVGNDECPFIVNGEGSSLDNVYKVEDCRIYFTFDDQNLDITDLIDCDTPYLYRLDITDNLGEVHERWIAVGGTPEYSGWGEAIVDVDGEGFTYLQFTGSFECYQYYIDGEAVTCSDSDLAYQYIDLYPYRYHYFGWTQEFREKFYHPSQEYYDMESDWHYPNDWEGEIVDSDILFSIDNPLE